MKFDLTITADAIATVLSVLGVLFIYWLNGRNEKRKAAIILVAEIQQAEESIKQIKNTDKKNDISEYIKVLPRNHWNDYKHLFATNFDSEEIKFLDEFYLSCEIIEEQLNLHRKHFVISMEEKTRLTQQELLRIVRETKDDESFNTEKQRVLESGFWLESDYFTTTAPTEKIIKYVNSVQLIRNTKVYSILKSFSKPWWEHLF